MAQLHLELEIWFKGLQVNELGICLNYISNNDAPLEFNPQSNLQGILHN